MLVQLKSCKTRAAVVEQKDTYKKKKGSLEADGNKAENKKARNKQNSLPCLPAITMATPTIHLQPRKKTELLEYGLLLRVNNSKFGHC